MAAASLLAIAASMPVLMCMLIPVASVAAVAALGVLAVATVVRVRMRVPAARAIMTLMSLAIRSHPCSIPPAFLPFPHLHLILRSRHLWRRGRRMGHGRTARRLADTVPCPCPCRSLPIDTS
jgi:hypothetical protein